MKKLIVSVTLLGLLAVATGCLHAGQPTDGDTMEKKTDAAMESTGESAQ